MASTSRILAKNLFQSPSPVLAPRTIPAISTNSTAAGTIFAELIVAARALSRASWTFTIPVFGSIVQNGKFAASAA